MLTKTQLQDLMETHEPNGSGYFCYVVDCVYDAEITLEANENGHRNKKYPASKEEAIANVEANYGWSLAAVPRECIIWDEGNWAIAFLYE